MTVMLAIPSLLALALAGALWPWTGLYDRRPTVRLLTALVCTSSVVVGLEVLLGLAGALAPVPLGIAASATAAVIAGAFLLHGARKRPAPASGDGKGGL